MKNYIKKTTTVLLIIFICLTSVFALCSFSGSNYIERYLYYKSVEKPTIIQQEYIRKVEDLWKKKYFNN